MGLEVCRLFCACRRGNTNKRFAQPWAMSGRSDTGPSAHCRRGLERAASVVCGWSSPSGEAPLNVLRLAWIEYERDRARYLAVAMIYYAIISFMPLLLLLLSALGLLLRFSAVAADATL